MSKDQKCEDCGAPMRVEDLGKPNVCQLALESPEEREAFSKPIRRLICTKDSRHTPIPL